ncbi:MAG TPA: glucosaminidase domain-containing protein [Stellaceae bacterium]|nr:glucosaminidase domain-containing protein [Stellaceae bacterium]
MDASVAQSLASGIDPAAIEALKGRPNDPAVRRAVAGQFGAMLMEGLMRNADGSPLSMVDGVGSNTVNALYTNVMSQVAASSNQLGFADMLLQSMPKAGATPPAATNNAAPGSPAPSRTPSTPPPSSVATGPGFSLQQYWQGRHVIATPGAAYAIAPVPMGPRPVTIAPPAPAPTAASPAASLSPYDAPSSPTAELTPSTQSGATTADRERFAATLAPLLQGAAQSLGVSPNVLLAQAALESGWGRSMPGNNLFGVKAGAGWTGGTVQAYTHEASANGEVGETSSFRAYPSLAAAVADYVQLIAHDGRYHAALGSGSDPMAYGQALVAGGYATDPNYASKLAAVAGSPTITAALATPSGTTVAQAAVPGSAA